VDVGDLFGYFVNEDGVDAETGAGGQSFAGELEENSFVHVSIKYRTGRDGHGLGQKGHTGQQGQGFTMV
jgi:hypothetical protein